MKVIFQLVESNFDFKIRIVKLFEDKNSEVISTNKTLSKGVFIIFKNSKKVYVCVYAYLYILLYVSFIYLFI